MLLKPGPKGVNDFLATRRLWLRALEQRPPRPRILVDYGDPGCSDVELPGDIAAPGGVSGSLAAATVASAACPASETAVSPPGGLPHARGIFSDGNPSQIKYSRV